MGFIKGEALRLLRTNSSLAAFKTAIKRFKTNLIERGYPETLAEITFEERKHALQQTQKANTRILPFVTQYRSSVPYLTHILMQNWHLIQQQPLLRRIFKDPPIVSYRRGRSIYSCELSSNWLLHVNGSRAGLPLLYYHCFFAIEKIEKL